MRSLENNGNNVLEAENRVPSLSIVIDDFDSLKEANNKEQKIGQGSGNAAPPRIYTRSFSDASIKKILEEAEQRKHEFWKLLDEHTAVIENLKRIEKFEHKII